jgi:electron transfer flavoprotein alpha subunit
MSVIAFVETADGAVKKSAFEVVGYAAEVAKMLNTTATAVVLGELAEAQLTKLGSVGAKKVLHATDSRLSDVVIQAYTSVLAQAVEKEGAEVVVLAKSSIGDAVAARLAAKIKGGLASNVVELPNLAGGFKVKRSIYTGKAFVVTEIKAGKKILALKKNAFEPVETAETASVEAFTPTLQDADFSVKITETVKATGEVLLPEADIVVSGGRGLKGPENWGIIEELAHALGAATACSKPVSDLDWRPHHEHVGQTGLKVSPNLYIAVGISGAIQHLAGVNTSKVIVAINKDPEAPFFKAADYGIVGDAFDIVPRLTKAVKELK